MWTQLQFRLRDQRSSANRRDGRLTHWLNLSRVSIAVLAILISSPESILFADDPPVQAELTESQQQRLKERDTFRNICIELSRLGKLGESLAAAKQMLAIEQEVLGPEHENTIRSMDAIAQLHVQLEDFTLAKDVRQQIQASQQKRFGSDHWVTQDAQRAVEYVAQLQKLSPTERQQLKQATELNSQVVLLHRDGKSRDAIVIAVQVMDMRKKVIGVRHPEYLSSVNNLALLYDLIGDSEKAEPLYREAMAIRREVLGDKHPECATGLINLGVLYQSRGDLAKAVPLYGQAVEINRASLGESSLEFAISLSHLGSAYESMSDFDKAEPLYRQALDVRRKVLGESHPAYAIGLNNLAVFYCSSGEYSKAEPLLRQALEINRVAKGENHPDYASGLNNLAAFYKATANYSKAEALYREALEIRRKVFGEHDLDYAHSLNNLAANHVEMGDFAKAVPLFLQATEIKRDRLGSHHPEYAMSLNNLAVTYRSMGDYSSAEPLYREALEVNRKALGEKHPDYATSLSNQALLYEAMGDLVKAEPLHREALEIRKSILGDQHPDYAISLNNLAAICTLTGDTEEAEPLFRQALEINRAVYGEKHPIYAVCLNNLAQFYNSKGDYDKAEKLWRQSLEIRGKTLGKTHPSYAAGLSNLAILCETRGDSQGAEPLYRQALEIFRVALGETHPQYAIGLENLGRIHTARGEYALAEPLFRQSVAITREHVAQTAATQSERQQFLMMRENRSTLNLYVSLAVSSGTYTEGVYQEVLLAKGSVWRRQQMIRSVQDDVQLAPVFAELQSVAIQRAQSMLAEPDAISLESWRERNSRLSQRQEDLERELSMRSEAYRAAQQTISVADLRTTLPEGHVLIDFWEYQQLIPPPVGQHVEATFERQLAAFVVRPDRPSVTLVSLGAVKPLSEAIDTWREFFGKPPAEAIGTLAAAQAAGRLLRQKIWEPLEPHLGGAGVVLVSPDGVLGRFPLMALPGKTPDSYLLEELPITVVPVPQSIVAMLKGTLKSGRLQASKNLLVVGDIDYDGHQEDVDTAAPIPKKKFGRDLAAVRGSDRKDFTPLSGTRGELASINKIYRDAFGSDGITTLERMEATESRLRTEAPRHKYLHVATHGFFAPAALRSTLTESTDRRSSSGNPSQQVAEYPPGLLSGLAMAGANQTPIPGQDDGILTATEVEQIDLRRTELVVLSACETGLGEVAGGEGLIGLQRAFQVAGAETVIASLWQVSDDATRSLMERFYENRLKKDLSPLESLREAQLWMLKEGPVRGLVRIKDAGQLSVQSENARTPPFYWAAFVLSGDWR